MPLDSIRYVITKVIRMQPIALGTLLSLFSVTGTFAPMLDRGPNGRSSAYALFHVAMGKEQGKNYEQ